ncbi:MAG TPA: glycosyltransferase family 4 protein [Acidimicrobiales bacterium]|nr:glycosyltransferase family 4 protein [Acidimicrobiales bacterium]
MEPIPSSELDRDAVHRAIAERAARSGIERVHLLAFRDLDDPDAGGSEVHAANVARHLAAAGLEVVHHTGRVRGAPAELQRDGVRVLRHGGRLGVFPRTARWLRRARLGPADGILEIFHGIPFFAPVFAPRVAHVGLVHHVHLGVWHHLLPAPGAAVGHLLERFAVPRVYRHRTILTIARSSREEVLRAYRADPALVGVADSGVADHFSPGGHREARPLVVVVARLMPQKGLGDLLQAFGAVRAALPEARLAIVGSGPERAAVERRVAALGLTGSVELTGFVPTDELVGWYRRAWVVASASVREGYNLTLVEGAACGTPSVARRIPGHVDAVVDGTSGLLVDDVPGLASALVEVLTDDALRERLGRGALEHARPFRWERTALAVVEALCQDADRRR